MSKPRAGQSERNEAQVSKDRPIKRVRADWNEVVLVCRKCSRKLDGGFGKGGEQSFAKALRKASGGGKGKDRKAPLAVIEVDCFDVCPKDAVVAVNASRPREWVVVPRGAPMEAVTARLGLAANDAEAA